ncbi:GIY-YIG nuclease family protein [Litoribacter alkaliphilus]|uniref:GIY-YIG nuclease family protein n=1 Tax=Litoribacter ruber TaxID=702568 RepID=A0AAP2CFR7_9BACT|nr:GIY-YIG nuclease family protein [Litoribacter alkaliphilus]MBS9523786.1 GIY-YIG nuclease family protein [Litoribacter alkaliphilus]
MAYFYVLYSEKLQKYYIGACTDLDRRLNEHNTSQSKFTSLGMPWALVYTESYPDLKFAKQRELSVKRKKSKRYIERLISGG